MEDNQAPTLDGSVYLYDQPELLSVKTHGDLGIDLGANRYGFTAKTRLVPLVFSEIASAQKHYPVVFSELGNPMPLAVLGVLEDRNLYVDDDGNWEARSYVPSYLRRYPFALARRNEEQFSMVIDRGAAVISKTPDLPFFEGDQPSESTSRMMEFCRQYDAATAQTKAFCERLKELELLVDQQVTHQPESASEPVTLANYVAVDTTKLQTLAAGELAELHQQGWLASIYAHAFSLENWNQLLERRVALGLSNEAID
ncbi:MAG: SapC family protein [Pseudomonadales bacterium]